MSGIDEIKTGLKIKDERLKKDQGSRNKVQGKNYRGLKYMKKVQKMSTLVGWVLGILNVEECIINSVGVIC